MRRRSGDAFRARGALTRLAEVSWASDRNDKFHARNLTQDETNVSPLGFTLPSPADEALQVWMRAAARPTFSKLSHK